MTPGLPHSPLPATAATCSHLLRHSDSAPPVLPFHPPQLALHSPFYDSRWEAGEVGEEAAPPLRRPLPPSVRLGGRPPAAGARTASRPPSGAPAAASRRHPTCRVPNPTPQLGKRPGGGALPSCFQMKQMRTGRHFLVVRELRGHHKGACPVADMWGPCDLSHKRTGFPRSVGAIIHSFVHLCTEHSLNVSLNQSTEIFRYHITTR